MSSFGTFPTSVTPPDTGSRTCAKASEAARSKTFVNESIHKVNECVRVTDIDRLQRIYHRILELLLAP